MKKTAFFLFVFCNVLLLFACGCSQETKISQINAIDITTDTNFFINDSGEYLDTMDKNTIQYKLCHYVHYNGRKLAPDYYQTNCSEFMTILMRRFYNLSSKDIYQININIKDKSDKENFWFYINNYSAKFADEMSKLNISFPNNHHNELMMDNQVMRVIWLAKGAGGFVEKRKAGYAIDIENAKAGDLVQIWYPGLYGHCGIVKYIDKKHKKIVMYSSFPSTGGFGVQWFDYHRDMITLVTRIEAVEKLP